MFKLCNAISGYFEALYYLRIQRPPAAPCYEWSCIFSKEVIMAMQIREFHNYTTKTLTSNENNIGLQKH